MIKRIYKPFFLLELLVTVLTGCSDDHSISPVNPNENIGEQVGNFTAAEWYPGGM
jgi:hypothetical protein